MRINYKDYIVSPNFGTQLHFNNSIRREYKRLRMFGIPRYEAKGYCMASNWYRTEENARYRHLYEGLIGKI